MTREQVLESAIDLVLSVLKNVESAPVNACRLSLKSLLAYKDMSTNEFRDTLIAALLGGPPPDVKGKQTVASMRAEQLGLTPSNLSSLTGLSIGAVERGLSGEDKLDERRIEQALQEVNDEISSGTIASLLDTVTLFSYPPQLYAPVLERALAIHKVSLSESIAMTSLSDTTRRKLRSADTNIAFSTLQILSEAIPRAAELARRVEHEDEAD